MDASLFKGVDIVFLPVSDLNRSIDWYSSIMGFTVAFKDEEHKAAGMATGNNVGVCLVQVRNFKPLVFPENDYLVDISFNYRAANIDQLHQHLTEKGIEVGNLNDSFNATFRCFGFEDLDGNRISVVS